MPTPVWIVMTGKVAQGVYFSRDEAIGVMIEMLREYVTQGHNIRWVGDYEAKVGNRHNRDLFDVYVAAGKIS